MGDMLYKAHSTVEHASHKQTYLVYVSPAQCVDSGPIRKAKWVLIREGLGPLGLSLLLAVGTCHPSKGALWGMKYRTVETPT